MSSREYFPGMDGFLTLEKKYAFVPKIQYFPQDPKNIVHLIGEGSRMYGGISLLAILTQTFKSV